MSNTVTRSIRRATEQRAGFAWSRSSDNTRRRLSVRRRRGLRRGLGRRARRRRARGAARRRRAAALRLQPAHQIHTYSVAVITVILMKLLVP